MKPAGLFCTALLVLTCSISVALAETSVANTVKCERDFMLQSVETAKDGTLLLAGGTSNTESNSAIMSIDTGGDILWLMKQNDHKGSSLYRDARYLDEDTIIALCSVRNDRGEVSGEWVVQFIEQGKVLHQTGPMMNVFGIHPTSDGFFAFGAPDSNSARIEKCSLEGEPLWKIDWNERLHFKGILSRDGVHVAFGDKAIRKNNQDSKPTGVLVAFDDLGKILWRHDSDKNEEYNDAVWSDDSHIVLVGNTIPSSGTNSDQNANRTMNGFVTAYNERGQVWRTDHIYSIPEENMTVDNVITSIVPVQNGYLTVQVAQQKIRLLLVDTSGNLIKEWDESVGDVYNPRLTSLLLSNGKVYLISSGKSGPVALDFEDDVPYPDEIMTIMEIEMPAQRN